MNKYSLLQMKEYLGLMFTTYYKMYFHIKKNLPIKRGIRSLALKSEEIHKPKKKGKKNYGLVQ